MDGPNETVDRRRSRTPSGAPSLMSARLLRRLGAATLWAVAIALVYILIAVLMMPRFISGELTFFGCCDASLQSFAWLNRVAEAARHHDLALWDFSIFGGTTLAGELQPGPFYPITIILGLLGAKYLVLANAYIYIHFAISLVSMHIFLRGVGASRLAAVAGATIFAFCGYVALQAAAQANIYAGLVLLPLVAHFFDRACHAERTSRTLALAGGAGLVGAAQIAAGHLQPFIYSSYALGIYALVLAAANRKSDWRRPILALLVSQVGALAFAAVPIFLSTEYLMRAYRWNQTGVSVWPHEVPLDTWIGDPASLRWHDLSTLFNAHSQIGGYYATLFFTITGLVIVPITLLRLQPLTRWLWLVLVFSLVIALGSDLGPLAYATYVLPLIAQTRTPARALFLYNFAAAALTAIAIDRLRDLLKSRPAIVREGLALVLLLSIIYETRDFFTSEIGMPVTFSQEAHRYYFENAALSTLEKLSTAGPLVDRFVMAMDTAPGAIVPPNAGDLFPVLDVLGARVTALQSFFDFLSQDWTYATSQSLDELGARWVLSGKPLDGMALVERGDGYYLYERPTRLSVLWAEHDGVRERVPVERVQWQDNRVTFWLGPDEASRQVVFAQPVYPGWEAFVDQKPAALDRKDIFMAVDVPGGTHEIEFIYRPRLLLLPLAITLVSFTLWIAIIAWDGASQRRITRRAGQS